MKLLFDFFPLVLFFSAFLLYDIYVATATAIVSSLTQVAAYWLWRRKFEKMHVIPLIVLLLLGGLTLATHNKSFIMWKPTVLYLTIAAVFLASHFIGGKPMIRRAFATMEDQFTVPDRLWVRFNLAWIALFLLAGAGNAYFVRDYQSAETAFRTAVPAVTQQQIDKYECESAFKGPALTLCSNAAHKERLWLYFKVPGIIGLTMLMMVVQIFFMMRYMKPDDTPVATPGNPTEERSP